MPILSILKGRRFEREFEFNKDHCFLGREEGNDLVLPDGSISRVHAKFVRDPGGWSIADLNSTNGIYLNNVRIQEMPIKEGDVLVAGEYTFFFRDPAAAGDGKAAVSSYQSLEVLFELTRRLKDSSALRDTLEMMTEKLMEIFQAERGILVLDEAKGVLGEPILVRRQADDSGRGNVSKTVANRVMSEKKPLLITDVEADAELREVQSIQTDQVRSIICAPILRAEGPPLGVVYLDSRVNMRVFTEKDLHFLETAVSHFSHLVQIVQESQRLKQDNQNLAALARDISRGQHDFEGIVGRSPRMRQVLDELRDLAREDVTCLITGESGTGKELFAQAVHNRSRRAVRPFVAVNLMALPRDLIESELFGHEKGAFSGALTRRIGKFEMAQGGTIFLDEMGELSLDVQVKLLRALQERRIYRIGGNEEIQLDIRLITATNRNLEQAIAKGEFREDLYYRINVFNLMLPPLRDRREDVPLLVHRFIETFNKSMGKQLQGVTEVAMERLKAYDWPGNVRELRNVIERAFVVEKGTKIDLPSLPFSFRRDEPSNPSIPIVASPAASAAAGATPADPASLAFPPKFEQAQEYFEKTFIVESLKAHGGNITLTSKMTGLPRRTLYRKLEKYGIDPKDLTDDEPADSDGE